MDFPIIETERITELDVASFEDLLEKISLPLINENYIKKEYINEILKNLKRNGPYFVLAPLIALPHALANDYVNNTCISIVRTKNLIKVGDIDAKLFIFLASNDSKTHMNLLTNMVSIMDSSSKQKKILECDLKELKNIFLNLNNIL